MRKIKAFVFLFVLICQFGYMASASEADDNNDIIKREYGSSEKLYNQYFGIILKIFMKVFQKKIINSNGKDVKIGDKEWMLVKGLFEKLINSRQFLIHSHLRKG